jgi:hypothetical protein
MALIALNPFQILSIGIFGIVFGFFEVVTNFFYLITKNYDLPRIQDGKELPKDTDDAVVFHKVIQMLLLGILLVIISLVSIFIAPQLFISGAVLIFLNGLIDYTKFQKKNMLILWSAIAVFCTISTNFL